MQKTAKNVFRQPPLRLNCSQAVAHAWEARTGTAGLVDRLAGCGGGNAPGGVCGALHAVRCVVGDGELRKLADAEFATAAGGAADCRSIRRNGVPCAECVGFAAEWLEKNMPGVRTGGAL